MAPTHARVRERGPAAGRAPRPDTRPGAAGGWQERGASPKSAGWGGGDVGEFGRIWQTAGGFCGVGRVCRTGGALAMHRPAGDKPTARPPARAACPTQPPSPHSRPGEAGTAPRPAPVPGGGGQPLRGCGQPHAAPPPPRSGGQIPPSGCRVRTLGGKHPHPPPRPRDSPRSRPAPSRAVPSAAGAGGRAPAWRFSCRSGPALARLRRAGLGGNAPRPRENSGGRCPGSCRRRRRWGRGQREGAGPEPAGGAGAEAGGDGVGRGDRCPRQVHLSLRGAREAPRGQEEIRYGAGEGLCGAGGSAFFRALGVSRDAGLRSPSPRHPAGGPTLVCLTARAGIS